MWLIRKIQHKKRRNDDVSFNQEATTVSHPHEIPEEKSTPTSNQILMKTPASTTTTTSSEAVEAATNVITIAIAGGGIVGLTLALCLHKHLITELLTNKTVDDVDMQKKNISEKNNSDVHINIIIYEQAPSFVNDVGAGISLHANGLRIIRDVDLLDNVVTEGYHYQYRHWTRHDGTIIATASEEVLSPSFDSSFDDQEAEVEADAQNLETLGIRRWKLQKILYDEVKEKNIPILFGKKIVEIQRNNCHASKIHSNSHQVTATCCSKTTDIFAKSVKEPYSPPLQLIMDDGSIEYADILLVADGKKSCIRDQLLSQMYNSDNVVSNDDEDQEEILYPHLEHSGITCLTGISNVKTYTEESLCSIREEEALKHATSTTITSASSKSELKTDFSMGISFPSSHTTGCHGVLFPTSKDEKCFQFYFPTSTLQQEDCNILSSWNPSGISGNSITCMSSWGTVASSDFQMECSELIKTLKHDGWHRDYIEPLENATSILRIGLSLLEPTSLNQFVYSINDVPYQQDHDNNDNSHKDKAKKIKSKNGGEYSNMSQSSMNRIVLLGDSAHPSIPYLGQGAQLGLEDAGVLVLLIKHFCIIKGTSLSSSSFSLHQWDHAMQIYEEMRIPRSHEILQTSLQFGVKQEMRSGQCNVENPDHDEETENYNDDITILTSRRLQIEEQYKREVFFHETLPALLPGVLYNYQTAVKEAIIGSSDKKKKKNMKKNMKKNKNKNKAVKWK